MPLPLSRVILVPPILVTTSIGPKKKLGHAGSAAGGPTTTDRMLPAPMTIDGARPASGFFDTRTDCPIRERYRQHCTRQVLPLDSHGREPTSRVLLLREVTCLANQQRPRFDSDAVIFDRAARLTIAKEHASLSATGDRNAVKWPLQTHSDRKASECCTPPPTERARSLTSSARSTSRPPRASSALAAPASARLVRSGEIPCIDLGAHTKRIATKTLSAILDGRSPR